MFRPPLLFLMLALATPVYAKPYPVPCSELWGAVTDTLENRGNYSMNTVDEVQMKASFVVVGALFRTVNSLYLKTKGDGCELKLRMGFTGNDDATALRSRVKRAVARRMAAKSRTAPPANQAGG